MGIETVRILRRKRQKETFYCHFGIIYMFNKSRSYLIPQFNEDEAEEVIQLVTTEDGPELNEENLPDTLPLLPIKNTVLFPGVVLPITIGRDKSINLVRKSYKGDRIIGVVAQKNTKEEEPSSKDIHKTGTIARILKMLVLPDGNTTIIIQGQKRFQVEEVVSDDPYLQATYKLLSDRSLDMNEEETQAIAQSLKDTAYKIMNLNPEIPKEAQIALENIESYTFLTHFLSSNVNAEVKENNYY